MNEAFERRIAAASDDSVVFTLEVSMKVQHLTAMRRFVADLTQSVVRDIGMASRLALVTHELLENAVKYSTDPRRRVTLQLSADADHRIQVTVINISNEPLYAMLKELLQQINQAPDPSANYQRMIARSIERESGSGLGLARICAEGEMQLSCELDGDMLSVTAQAQMGERP